MISNVAGASSKYVGPTACSPVSSKLDQCLDEEGGFFIGPSQKTPVGPADLFT